jgi:hypothetical protein
MRNSVIIFIILFSVFSCRVDYPCPKNVQTIKIGLSDNLYKNIDSLILENKTGKEVYYKKDTFTIKETEDLCSRTCGYANGCSDFFDFYTTYLVYKNISGTKQIKVANTYFANYLDGYVVYDQYNVSVDTINFVIPSYLNERDRAYFGKYVYKEYVGNIEVNNKRIESVYKVYPTSIYREYVLMYGPNKKIVGLINLLNNDSTRIY